LLPILLLACVATRCGYRSQAAMAAWGREHGRGWLRRLGFAHGRGPSQPTRHRVFKGIAYAAVAAALRGWAEQALQRCPASAPGALEGVALDGKTLRGSTRRGAADAHLLAALRHRLGVVLGHCPEGARVADKTTAIGAADALLLALVLEGRVVTADALLAQRGLARAVLARGGDYLLVGTGNQPGRRGDSEVLFGDPDLTGDLPAAETVSPHGGRVETRRLTASPARAGSSDWPGLQQALRLERRVVAQATGAVRRQETAYAVTSLTPAAADPAPLLALWRAPWSIAKRRHWVRDGGFDEDRAQVHCGHIPQVMAAWRTAAIGLLRLLGAPNIAAATRRYAAPPARALAALGLPHDFE
jgi:predicted transposase YbfD/YdcC